MLRKSSLTSRRLPHSAADLWDSYPPPPRRPGLNDEVDLLPRGRTRPCLKLPARRKQKGVADPLSVPLRGGGGVPVSTPLRWGGCLQERHRLYVWGLPHWRVDLPPSYELQARLLHGSTAWLPLCFFVLQQFRFGRRHYHIALRGSRHLTAGTKEPGGRPAVKSTSGWSIEPLGGTAPRGTPSSPSTNERLRLGPERPPIPGGPRWSPRWGGGPGTVPVCRGRHFTRG